MRLSFHFFLMFKIRWFAARFYPADWPVDTELDTQCVSHTQSHSHPFDFDWNSQLKSPVKSGVSEWVNVNLFAQTSHCQNSSKSNIKCQMDGMVCGCENTVSSVSINHQLKAWWRSTTKLTQLPYRRQWMNDLISECSSHSEAENQRETEPWRERRATSRFLINLTLADTDRDSDWVSDRVRDSLSHWKASPAYQLQKVLYRQTSFYVALRSSLSCRKPYFPCLYHTKEI